MSELISSELLRANATETTVTFHRAGETFGDDDGPSVDDRAFSFETAGIGVVVEGSAAELIAWAQALYLNALRHARTRSEVATIRHLLDLATTGIENTEDGVRFTAWSDGWAVGYRVVHAGDADVEHVYLNASGGSDHGKPDVFVYHTDEHPDSDSPLCFINVHKRRFPGRDEAE